MKHRVVSVGDRRSAQRMINVVTTALADADIKLSHEEQLRLWDSLLHVWESEGYVLTRQVTEAN